jgi:uncharacterized protein
MTTRSVVFAFVAGLLFGGGLVLSGMTDPAKVIGFLDITRDWDPSLAFVMLGAVGVYALASRTLASRDAPWLDACFHVPPQTALDRRLVLGSAVFGVGWGLAGYCPGPGIVAAGGAVTTALVFVAAMCAGMVLQHALVRRAD